MYLLICMCTMRLLCLQTSKEGTTSLNLELEIVMSYRVGAEKPTWVLCKNKKCS